MKLVSGLAALFAASSLSSTGWAVEAEPGLTKEAPSSGRFVQTDRGYMVPYSTIIPGTAVEFSMEPIPGGKFKFGSPASEKGRKAAEGPQIEVEVEPFWMGRYEITWAEYKYYMTMHDSFKKLVAAKIRVAPDEKHPDVVTAPSNLYDPSFTFEKGEDLRLPAVTMSQFAAKQYTKWLSGLTGQFYRLPSEAEWEYACRAGSDKAYGYGDSPENLKDYAWYFENSDETTHQVGKKKPNAWGLFDMHGNVGEWVLDEYTADGYKKFTGKSLKCSDAVVWPTKLFPRVVRGGSWDEDAAACRSAARLPSHDDEWRSEDPNFPQSPWWFTTGPALGVGFRIIRPLSAPAKADRAKYWEADLELLREHVKQRIDKEGRGARGIADATLPGDIHKSQERK